MFGANSRVPAGLALVGSALGLLFATNSTLDYANHLDRRLHDVHCSFIPGAPPTADADACRAAMYSPYSALFKEQYWGGIPISLFAIGAFAFLGGFALYLLLSGARAPRKAVVFYAAVSTTPLLVSLMMFVISLTKLGSICQTCMGIYLSSLLTAVGGLLCLTTLKPGPAAGYSPGPYDRPANVADAASRPVISSLFPIAWLGALGVATLIPARIYAMSVPDHTPYLGRCGELKKKPIPDLLKLATSTPTKQATLFEDPLCPTCKAFHQRLVVGDMFEKLDAKLALFPLDSECNWMLDQPMHPGACIVSRAVICGGPQSRTVLEWAYDEQDMLTEAGKQGAKQLTAVIERRWGKQMTQCMERASTKRTLNNHLHYATDNSIPVSTPQVYLEGKRFCDEDTDIGLRFSMAQMAPEVVR